MDNNTPAASGLQVIVFALVSASFTTIYLLQPVLPVIQQEFGIDEKQASLGISALILGIALANLPFGRLADRCSIKPIIAVGGGWLWCVGWGAHWPSRCPIWSPYDLFRAYSFQH